MRKPSARFKETFLSKFGKDVSHFMRGDAFDFGLFKSWLISRKWTNARENLHDYIEKCHGTAFRLSCEKYLNDGKSLKKY